MVMRKAALIALFLEVFFPIGVMGLDCNSPGFKESFEKARFVFTGEVIERPNNEHVKFKVTRSYKGTPGKEVAVVVDIWNQDAFKIGFGFLVFADSQDDLFFPKLIVSSCGRTKSIDAAKEDLSVLDGITSDGSGQKTAK